MNFVIVHPSKTSRGGIFNATLIHAIAIKKLGHNVTLLSASKAYEPLCEKFGLTFIYDKNISHSFTPMLHPKSWKLRTINKAEKVDAVIHEGGKSWAWARMYFPRCPHFVVFHNSKIGVRKFYLNWLVLSQGEHKRLSQLNNGLFKRDIQTIKNGILPFKELSESEVRKYPGNTFRIGALAEIREKKGYDVLIRAAASLIKKGHNIELTLGGSGDTSSLQKLVNELDISENVKFPGWIENKKEFYDSIDLFCLPSLAEPFGLVVLEAMYSGLPIIATNTFGPNDIITNEKNGWIVDIGDARMLASCIEQRLCEPKEKLLQIGQAGKQHVLENYSLEAIGESIVEAVTNA